MEQVRLGFEHGLTINQVDIYAKSCFDPMQMEEIRFAFEDGLTLDDIDKFAKPEFGYEQMNHVRIKIRNEKKVDENKQADLTKKYLFNIFLFAVIAGLLIVIVVGSILAKGELTLYFEQLELVLSDSEVEVEYNSPFLAMNYVKEYTEKDGVELILPEEIHTDVLGSQIVLYKVRNAKKVITRELIVNVVDRTAPILELSDSEVTLIKNKDQFSCRVYIAKAEDNVDKNIIEKVKCSDEIDLSKNEQEIEYSVSDESGNEVSKKLIVYLKEEPKPIPVKPIQKLENNTGYVPAPVPAPAPVQTWQSGSESYSESSDTGWIYEDIGGCEVESSHEVIEE